MTIKPIVRADAFDYMATLESNSIQLIATDIPYGVTDCTWDIKPDIGKMFAEFRRLLSDTGTIIMTASEPLATELRSAALDLYKYDIYWINYASPTMFIHAKNTPLRVVECL